MKIFAAVVCLTGLTGASQVGSPMEPTLQAAECIVALRAEQDRSRASEDAKRYFDRRVREISNPQMRQIVMDAAEDAIRTNTNRREIASTCLLLYQVQKLQEDRAVSPAPGASPQ
ncbi:MAG TPA: hypothetical protein VFF48_12045 [Brevundimonas sp.]|nr:hypothetical protein [Brevundimonas sp.]